MTAKMESQFADGKRLWSCPCRECYNSPVDVLVAGGVKSGGAGCYCPENALVRALISHLLVDEKTALEAFLRGL